MIRTILLVIGLISASFAPTSDNPGDAAKDKEAAKPSQASAKADDPVALVKQLLLAMVSNDKETIREITVPNPDAAVLWSGQKVPDEAVEMIKKELESAKCRELKVGDVFVLPNKKELKITDKMVNEDKKMFVPTIGGQEMPTPLAVRKTKGQWKVDAGPLIAARLAAKKAMEEHRQQQ